jgi:mannose/cellobiose epimerase-like protein (N-acyl-D-glucosamine 2-epimerase family)
MVTRGSTAIGQKGNKMKTIETALKTGIEYLDAGAQSDGTYLYVASETGETYRVTREDIVDLGMALLSEDADTRRDAYSLWCTECGELVK